MKTIYLLVLKSRTNLRFLLIMKPKKMKFSKSKQKSHSIKKTKI